MDLLQTLDVFEVNINSKLKLIFLKKLTIIEYIACIYLNRKLV